MSTGILIGCVASDLPAGAIPDDWNVLEIEVENLPKTLIKHMGSVIVFTAEYEPHVGLCVMAQPASEGRPSMVMLRDGELFVQGGAA